MHVHTLTTDLWLPRSRSEIFAFFSDAMNLDTLTPPWLRFRILTPAPIILQLGTQIEYRLRWRALPLFWRTEIAAWEPPFRFVDRALKSPYRLWEHEHLFEEVDGGTRMLDRVRYAVPGWLLAPLVERWVVGPDVRRIFAYRRTKMQELFGA